jgi:hypothetical protein
MMRAAVSDDESGDRAMMRAAVSNEREMTRE